MRVHVVVTVRDERAHERRRGAEDRDAVPLDDRPDAIGRRVVGRAFVQQHSAAVRAGADHFPRAHDPAHVGEPEQQIVVVQIDLIRDLLGDLHQEPAVHVNDALRTTGRPRRVRDE